MIEREADHVRQRAIGRMRVQTLQQACHPVAEKSGIVSATVGRSGNSGRRLSDATAIALIAPDWIAPAMPE